MFSFFECEQGSSWDPGFERMDHDYITVEWVGDRYMVPVLKERELIYPPFGRYFRVV